MKIAYITETWLPSVDGIVTRLAATVGQVRGAGHDVLVIAPRGEGGEGVPLAGTAVRTVPTVGFRFLYDGKRWGLPLPRVDRYLREFDPDVVHVLNPVLLGIAGVAAARRQHRTLVTSYHTDLAHYARNYHLGWSVPLIWALQRRLHAAAHLNLATSRAAATDLAAHGITGTAEWPRGVDLDLFHPADPAAVPYPPRARPVALSVGRLAPEKGLHRLTGLTGTTSPVQLVLVGDGPARTDLHHRFGAAATFTGPLHGPALAEAYRHADVFVFPSTTDTLGLVLLEALASGLPVVAADTPASRETLAACPAARLFPAEHPERLPTLIGELLASAPRDMLAHHARAHAERWGWAAATTALLEHYRQARGLPHTPIGSADTPTGSARTSRQPCR